MRLFQVLYFLLDNSCYITKFQSEVKEHCQQRRHKFFPSDQLISEIQTPLELQIPRIFLSSVSVYFSEETDLKEYVESDFLLQKEPISDKNKGGTG